MLKEFNRVLTYDLKFTTINQLWRLLSGPIILLLIPTFLTSEKQGYWFTMTSLAAMAVFADLGFSNILLQFSAHEFAHLEFKKDGTVAGSEEHLKRISALFVFALRWSMLIITVAFPIIFLIGYYILSHRISYVTWKYPWIIYSIGSLIVYFNSILLAFIEGCDSVARTQKIRFQIAAISSFTMIMGLIFRLDLYALGLALLVSSLIGFCLILNDYFRVFAQLLSLSRTSTYEWGSEIFPLLWRYAVSWVSGYLMFQLFTPVVFHYHGAVEAGRVGISIALFTALFSISNVWITSILPKINICIAQKDYKKLDTMFYRHFGLSIITFVMGTVVLLGLAMVLKGKTSFLDRFLSPLPMLFLAISWLFQMIIHNIAIYLRSHKEEPLVSVSLVSATYIVITTLLCVIYLDQSYLFLGFLTSYLWSVPWVYLIFRRRKSDHRSHIQVISPAYKVLK